MDTPKNWLDHFLYLPVALPVSFHEVFLEAFLGTGFEDDLKIVVPILEQQTVYPHMEIQVIDEAFCERMGKKHLLLNKTEVAGHKAHGVVATQDISEDTVLGEYGGVISFSLPTYPELKNGSVNPYMWQISARGKKMYIDGFKATNELAFINEYHNIAPEKNVEARAIVHRGRLRFCYVTCAPVEAGEELLVDYSQN